MKILPLFLLFFIFIQSSSAKEKNPLNFVFNGKCPADYEGCLPYSSLSFRTELAAVKDEEILNRLNDFIAKNPHIFLKPLEVYQINEKPRNFGLRARELLKKRETYLNITFDYMISNDEINYEIMFPNLKDTKFPIVPTFNDSYYFLGDKTGYLPDVFRFITNFLFHMYHLNESYLKDSLIGLPLDFKQAPIMTMIPPEFTLFRDLTVGQATVIYRKETLDAWDYYNIAFEKAWTKAERKLFFNNRLKVNLDDFVYAFFIMRTRGLSFVKQNKIVMIPVHFMAKNNDKVLRDNDERYLGQMIDFHYKMGWDSETNKSSDIAVLAEHAYEKDEPIILNYKTGNTIDLFMFLGILPKENPNDCFDYQFFDDKFLRELRLTFGRCVRIKDFKRAYLIGNIMNMEDQSITECKEKTSQVEWNSDEFYTKLDQECVHPKWSKKNDIWINAVDRLEESADKLEGIKTTALEYTNYRNSMKLPVENAELIRNYVDKRIELTQRYLKEIKDLKKYSKNKQKESSKKKGEL